MWPAKIKGNAPKRYVHAVRLAAMGLSDSQIAAKIGSTKSAVSNMLHWMYRRFVPDEVANKRCWLVVRYVLEEEAES